MQERKDLMSNEIREMLEFVDMLIKGLRILSPNDPAITVQEQKLRKAFVILDELVKIKCQHNNMVNMAREIMSRVDNALKDMKPEVVKSLGYFDQKKAAMEILSAGNQI